MVSRIAGTDADEREEKCGMTIGGTILTPRAAKILASCEALAKEHGLSYIGCESLLLACLKSEASTVKSMLESAGLDQRDLAEKMTKFYRENYGTNNTLVCDFCGSRAKITHSTATKKTDFCEACYAKLKIMADEAALAVMEKIRRDSI